MCAHKTSLSNIPKDPKVCKLLKFAHIIITFKMTVCLLQNVKNTAITLSSWVHQKTPTQPLFFLFLCGLEDISCFVGYLYITVFWMLVHAILALQEIYISMIFGHFARAQMKSPLFSCWYYASYSILLFDNQLFWLYGDSIELHLNPLGPILNLNWSYLGTKL